MRLNKINKCIDKLYKDDIYLFECKICERALMFRLAYYLQKEFPNYIVDCEFNKMGFNGYMSNEKVLLDDSGALKKIYVDIIIHKRNSNIKDNLICIEIKRQKRYLEKDFRRLKLMTRGEGFKHENKRYVFNYDFGLSILLPNNKENIEINVFENGRRVNI